MNYFVKTDRQQTECAKLDPLIPVFRKREPLLDELNSFPYDNIRDLKEIGYHTFTLPVEHGGEGSACMTFCCFKNELYKVVVRQHCPLAGT